MRKSLPIHVVAAAALLVFAVRAPAAGSEVRMSLDQCLSRALRASLQIRAGGYGPPIARTQVIEASSTFDHLFSFQVNGGRSVQPTASALGGAPTLQQQTFDAVSSIQKKIVTGGVYSFGLETHDLLTNSKYSRYRPQWTSDFTFRFTQPLLRGAGSRYNLAPTRIAKAELRASRFAYQDVVQGTLAAVERSYWQLVFAREDLDVKQQSLNVARELAKLAQRRLDAGAGTRIDLLQAQAGAAQREQDVIVANKQVKDAEDALASYVFPFVDAPERQTRIIPTDGVGSPPAKIDTAPERWIRSAFASRPDVRAERARLEETGIRVVQQENELLPKLDFQGSFGLNGLDTTLPDSMSPIYQTDYTAWEIGLTLEIPIGNRAAEARYHRALLQRSQEVARFQALENQVVVDVRSAIREIETARQEIAASHKAVVAAQAEFDAERDRVDAGKATNYELLQVENDLSRAKSQEIAGRVSFKTARVDLETATGTYLQYRKIALPPPHSIDSGVFPGHEPMDRPPPEKHEKKRP